MCLKRKYLCGISAYLTRQYTLSNVAEMCNVYACCNLLYRIFCCHSVKLNASDVICSVMKVAKKYADSGKDVKFAVSNAEDFTHELSEYGLTFTDKPVVAARNANDEKFVMKDSFR